MPIKAVVFDLDGTIVKFQLDYISIRSEAIQALAKLGLPQSLFSIRESIFKMYDTAVLYLKNNGEEKSIERVYDVIFSIAERYELEAARQAELIPGVTGILDTLRDMGLKLGLCTNDGAKATKFILKKFRLDQVFDLTVTREQVPRVKPDPVHLQAVLVPLNVAPKEVVVTGDHEVDMRMAKTVGAIAVGVTTGFSTRESLITSGADYVLPSIVELPRVIRNLK
ncbi:HAD family hydrolase [Candidatus Bathyarchaeota archaeon]|nr:HAD family hydrolase [Candidatus Bathyarchaeota archaeon]